MMKGKCVVVLGTTASGKTRLAVKLARRFHGEIVSADSRQVYRGLDIGTGKDLQEYGSIPYHLIDIVSPRRYFTVAEFQRRAFRAIDSILKKSKIPILCGGSGLYLQAVLEGYVLAPVEKKRTKKYRIFLQKKSLDELLSLLREIDPKTYQEIDKKNRRRVQRALEIYFETGVPKSLQQKKQPPEYDFLLLGKTFPRDILKKKIARRLRRRLREGMVEEVRRLKKQGLSWKRLEALGLEYRWVSRYLRGFISYGEMEEQLLEDIVRFAKRQMTWFRRMSGVYWVQDDREAIKLVQQFLSR